MSLQVAVIRSSFEVVARGNPVARFYDILFERYPRARPLFGHRHTPDVQERMFTEALVAVVEHLEDAPWLEERMTRLGREHVGYGVTDEMYDWVGECLLAAMAEVADAGWSEEAEAAWSEAYASIAGFCLKGARARRAEIS